MAMLTHDFERPVRRSSKQRRVGSDADRSYTAVLKRLFLCALTVLLAGGAVAGIIALKTAVYFARYHLIAG